MAENTSREILNQAIEEYDPRYVIAMFSGGHDSLVSTHIAKQHPRFSFALHINTGIGIEETRQFVRQTCDDWKIELREYKASEYIRANGKPDPQIYEQIVIEHGFPGAKAHDYMYIRLKERALRLAIRDLCRKRNDKTMIVTGVRKDESIRRMKHVDMIQIWEGTKIWVAPIYEFSKRDINDYIEENRLKRNPVVDKLHMSGECLCGAFAHKGEKEEIRFWFPEIAEYIDRLEEEVMKNHPWRWEDGPPEWIKQVKRGQRYFPNMLCMTCEAMNEPAAA